MIIAMQKIPLGLYDLRERERKEQKNKNEINMIYGILDKFAKLSISAQLYLRTQACIQRIQPNIICLYLTRLLLTHGLKSVLGEYLENANKTRENRQNFHKLMPKFPLSNCSSSSSSNTNGEYTVAFVVCNNACNEMTRISN